MNEPRSTAAIFEAVLILLASLALIGWILWRTLRKSQEPMRLAWKWGVTALLVGWWGVRILPDATRGGAEAIFALIVSLPIFLVLGVMWAPNMASMLASPLAGIFDGGDEEPDVRPVYSIAEARLHQGRVHEAVAEIRRQLVRFPNDVTGRLMLAEIQAGKLGDPFGAEETLRALLSATDLSPGAVVAAANLLADLQLRHARDPQAAREALEEIVRRLPDTPQARNATERISHLPSVATLENQANAPTVELKHGPRDLGLRPVETLDEAATLDQRVNVLLDRVQQFPADTESRDQLIRLLSEELHDLESARAQVGFALAIPHQTARQQARWLNLLATVEIRCGHDLEAARRALQRVVAQFPDSAVAETARRRLDGLPTELKGTEAGKEVSLGTYERDLGLKKRSPSPGS